MESEMLAGVFRSNELRPGLVKRSPRRSVIGNLSVSPVFALPVSWNGMPAASLSMGMKAVKAAMSTGIIKRRVIQVTSLPTAVG